MADRRVLLIDNDKNFHDVLRRSLVPYGVEVHVVADGSDGVARAIELKPELIFIAVDLPDKAGYGICNKIRRGDTRKIPVALVTATVPAADFDQHRKLPKGHADAYFDKRTITIEDLIARIDGLVSLGPPQADMEEEFPVEEIPFEDDSVALEEEADEFSVDSSEIEGADGIAVDEATRVSSLEEIDPSIDRETESAFAGMVDTDTPISADFEVEDAPATSVRGGIDRAAVALGGVAEPVAPRPAPKGPPAPPPADPSDGEIDLGLDAVAEAAGSGDGPSARIAELQAEVQKLKKDVEDARKSGGASGSPFTREREFLNLREVINRKEKEIIELKDEVDAKDRQILAVKEKNRELEKKVRAEEQEHLADQGSLVTANETIEQLKLDKDKGHEREKGLKARVDLSQAEIKKSHEETESWKKKHAVEVTGRADDIARLKADAEKERQEAAARLAKEQADGAAALKKADEERLAQLSALKADLDGERTRALAAAEEARRQAEAALRDEHDGEIAALHKASEEATARRDREHREALQRAAEAREAALAKAEERRLADLADADAQRQGELAAAEERREEELSKQAAQHRNELAAMVTKHTGEMAAAEDRRAKELGEAEARRQGELATAEKRRQQELADAEKKRQKDLAEAEDQHTQELGALKASYDHEREELDAQHAQTVAELRQEIATLEQALAGARDNVKGLEGELAAARATIAQRDRTIEGLQGDVAARDSRISGLRAEIEELERQNAGLQDQVLKAYQKIKSDDAVVQKAKKAMAIALTLLDDNNSGGQPASS